MARSLEAYLLWLFGYIMFNNTHGNSVERLAVGRPLVSHEPYHGGMYGDEEDERPTMRTIWIWRQVRSQQI